MKLLYYSPDIAEKQSDIRSTLSKSAAEIELLPVLSEEDFFLMLPRADILVIREADFDRLLLQVISSAEKAQKRRKIAVLKEPAYFSQETVFQILKQLYSNNVTLHFPIKNGETELSANEILYFEYADRFVYIRTEKERIKTTLRLKDLPVLVTGCPFFSPYVSFMVNLMHVESITGNCVFLKNGEQLPLSQKKASAFRKAYREYLSIMS